MTCVRAPSIRKLFYRWSALLPHLDPLLIKAIPAASRAGMYDVGVSQGKSGQTKGPGQLLARAQVRGPSSGSRMYTYVQGAVKKDKKGCGVAAACNFCCRW